MRTLRLVAAGLLVAVSAATARAQTWAALLSGTAESPPNASPATGRVFVSITGNTLSITMNWSGLLGTSTASHIHCCTAAPFTNTAGIATVTPTFPIPLGVTSGAFSGSYDLSLVGSYNPAFLSQFGNDVALARAAFIAGLNSGTAYLNVHSTFAPGGEIRGFLVPTPEPSTYALLATGLAGVGVLAQRRRTRG